jgi:hypothetical protein
MTAPPRLMSDVTLKTRGIGLNGDAILEKQPPRCIARHGGHKLFRFFDCAAQARSDECRIEVCPARVLAAEPVRPLIMGHVPAARLNRGQFDNFRSRPHESATIDLRCSFYYHFLTRTPFRPKPYALCIARTICDTHL